jgi:hypothetical protein
MNVYTVGPEEEIFSIVPTGPESSFKNANPALRTGLLPFSATACAKRRNAIPVLSSQRPRLIY